MSSNHHYKLNVEGENNLHDNKEAIIRSPPKQKYKSTTTFRTKHPNLEKVKTRQISLLIRDQLEL